MLHRLDIGYCDAPARAHAEQVVVLEISKAGRRQQHSRPQAAQAERASLGFKGEKRLYNSHASPLRHHPSQTQLVRLAKLLAASPSLRASVKNYMPPNSPFKQTCTRSQTRRASAEAAVTASEKLDICCLPDELLLHTLSHLACSEAVPGGVEPGMATFARGGDALTALFVCVSQAPDNVMQSKIALEFGEVFSKLTVSCHDIIAAIWVAFFSRWQRYRC